MHKLKCIISNRDHYIVIMNLQTSISHLVLKFITFHFLGNPGVVGATGRRGFPGPLGRNGNDGVDGAQGQIGNTGAAGPVVSVLPYTVFVDYNFREFKIESQKYRLCLLERKKSQSICFH